MNASALRDLDKSIQNQVQYWLEAGFDDSTKNEIRHLIETDRKALIDAFYTRLSFGTGGLRGIMGVGPNRMNEYTVGWATQGLANYLKMQFRDATDLRVAIGYDSRINSQSFAMQSARTLAANGIKAFIFKELRPTPLVSFACRFHHCQAAIMVTASHNPPAYNGYKVYWNDGAQVLPPHDVGIMQQVNCLHDPSLILKTKPDDPLIVFMTEEEDLAYLRAISTAKLIVPSTHDHIHVLYSSLHGTGATLMRQALKEFGFVDVDFVDKQCVPDGTFPTCPRPNPEEKEALQLGIEQMMKSGRDIFIATDPDADRVGVVVRHNNESVIINGNQIASLLAYFICKNMQLPKNAAFVKTIVTTELFSDIVKAHGAQCFDVLTGFKYIAEKIRQWESEKNGPTYVFGGEESYGYLFGTHVRDKDAIISSCLIVQAALYAKQRNMTLVDLLHEIYREFGLYCEQLIYITFEESKAGKDAIQERMKAFRNERPDTLAGEKIVRITDLSISCSTDCQTNQVTSVQLPVSDVLIWELAKGTKVVIRPSGTEPKMKIYLMLKEPKGFKSVEEAQNRCNEKANRIRKELGIAL